MMGRDIGNRLGLSCHGIADFHHAMTDPGNIGSRAGIEVFVPFVIPYPDTLAFDGQGSYTNSQRKPPIYRGTTRHTSAPAQAHYAWSCCLGLVMCLVRRERPIGSPVALFAPPPPNLDLARHFCGARIGLSGD